MPLIPSSNVIWNAYRLIAETKIFRLGVSLICLLYVKEEWIGKKYNTERYNILLQIPRIFRHIYNKWSILIIQYKSTLNLHLLYMNIYKYILLFNLIYIYIYIYYYILLSNLIYIYILWALLCFLFIATLSQLIRTMVTLVSHLWSFPDGFTSKNGLHNCEHDPSY